MLVVGEDLHIGGCRRRLTPHHHVATAWCRDNLHGAFIELLTSFAPDRTGRHHGRHHGWRRAALGFVFLWFFLGGIAHFALTDVEMRIVPPLIPWPRAAVLVSGVFELLGAAGLLWRPTRRAAGVGLVLLTLAVTPANVYMLQHAGDFHVPRWALVLRLPLQAALVALIVWGSWPRPANARP